MTNFGTKMRYLLLLFPLWIGAQTSRTLDANFRFRDGVYLSHQALLNNTPDAPWSEITGEMVQLSEDFRLQIDGYGYKTSDYRPPYAVALDGLPYLFVRHNTKRDYHEFSGLRTLGTFATVQYDTIVHAELLMRAYNPANGLAFREGYVKRDQQRTLDRIIDMQSGRRLPLDQPTVMRLVGEETDLLAALERSERATTERLLRAIRIYNDRHPLLLPASQPNR